MSNDKGSIGSHGRMAGPIERAALQGFGFTLGAVLALAIVALAGFALYEGFGRLTGARGAQQVIEEHLQSAPRRTR